jgi:tRNA-dihydrouridine synthase B
MRKFWDSSAPRDGCAPGRVSLQPVPKFLPIGPVSISPATVLAPMAGVTDTVFRRFIRNLGGCGLIMTEFTSADGVLRKKDQKAKRYLHFYDDEHPISAQLFGSDPKVMAEAARMVEGLGFDLVDLNLGCPAKKVVKCNGGSGLLRDLPAIGKIFESVRAAVSIPFTVKFRAGWSDQEIVCVELARLAENCGLAAVALHARTREQGYSGQARWEWIAAVKNAVKIPVIGNGDIRTPQDACAMVTQTGCDAVMIGRMAPSNPWIFRQIEQYSAAIGNLDRASADRASPVQWRSTTAAESESQPGTGANWQGHGLSRGIATELCNAALATEGCPCPHDAAPAEGTALRFPDVLGMAEAAPCPALLSLKTGDGNRLYEEPSESDRYQMIRTYFRMLIEEELPDAVGKMKQFASWFTHGVPGGAALRKAIYESKNAPDVLGRVEDFFAARLCAATAPGQEL